MLYDEFLFHGDYQTLITADGAIQAQMPASFALQWAKLNSATHEKTELIETNDGESVYIKCSIPFQNRYQKEPVYTAISLYNQKIKENDSFDARAHNMEAYEEIREDGSPVAVLACNLYTPPEDLIAELCELKRELKAHVPEYTASYKVVPNGDVRVTSVDGESITLSRNDINYLFKVYQREYVLKEAVKDRVEEMVGQGIFSAEALSNAEYINAVLDKAEQYEADGIEGSVQKAIYAVKYRDFVKKMEPETYKLNCKGGSSMAEEIYQGITNDTLADYLQDELNNVGVLETKDGLAVEVNSIDCNGFEVKEANIASKLEDKVLLNTLEKRIEGQDRSSDLSNVVSFALSTDNPEPYAIIGGCQVPLTTEEQGVIRDLFEKQMMQDTGFIVDATRSDLNQIVIESYEHIGSDRANEIACELAKNPEKAQDFIKQEPLPLMIAVVKEMEGCIAHEEVFNLVSKELCQEEPKQKANKDLKEESL